jgi:MoaA/NifB/PqqE/SkfB family radical SAM enzyme
MVLKNLYNRISGYQDINTLTLLRHPRINHLVIYANAVCNAHCKMCDVGIGAGDGIAKPLEGMPREMGLPLMKKILDDELIAGRKVHVNFLMTEPLLNRKLPEMLKMCKQRHHTVKITTNGFLLAARAEEIRSHVDIVQVSLDGPEQVHDSIRGQGFFAAAVEGIKALRRMNARVKVEINCTISNLNYFCLYDLLRLVDEIGVNVNLIKYQCLDFVTESMRDRHNARFPDIPQTTSSITQFTDFKEIDTQVLQRQIDLIRTFKPSHIETVAFKPPVQTVADLEAYFDPDGHPLPGWDRCATPWVSVAINTGGQVLWHMRCFSDYILGDINRDSLRRIFYGEKAESFRRRFKESNLCFPACTRCCGVMTTE